MRALIAALQPADPTRISRTPISRFAFELTYIWVSIRTSIFYNLRVSAGNVLLSERYYFPHTVCVRW